MQSTSTKYVCTLRTPPRIVFQFLTHSLLSLSPKKPGPSSSSLVLPADLRHNFSRPSQYVNVVWATPKQMKTLERLGCSSSHWSHSVSKWALLYVRSLVILPKEEYHLKVTLNIWPAAAYSFIRYSPPPSLILQPAVLPSAGSVAKFHKSVGYRLFEL